jgi:2-oxo-4-hydroxy-4-carboxy-5-ureidoimidazoline decarboxylase
MDSVDGFNRLADDAARRALRDCCSSARWVEFVAAGRPYPGIGALVDASDAAVALLNQVDLAEALAGHPRIGDRRLGGSGAAGAADPGAADPGTADPGTVSSGRAGWSGQEQAGVATADEAVRRALDEGNEAYERRFGHIYLACATGRSAAELLAFLRERLANDSETEWTVVAAELAKINQIRLRKVTGGMDGGGAR